MAIFCPTNLFMSVDFPAFGRPTMAANPDRPRILLSFMFPLLENAAIRSRAINGNCGTNSLRRGPTLLESSLAAQNRLQPWRIRLKGGNIQFSKCYVRANAILNTAGPRFDASGALTCDPFFTRNVPPPDNSSKALIKSRTASDFKTYP